LVASLWPLSEEFGEHPRHEAEEGQRMTDAFLDIPSGQIERAAPPTARPAPMMNGSAVRMPELRRDVWAIERPVRDEDRITEADRLAELEELLEDDFNTFREVRIEHHWMNFCVSGRVDLLAVPKARDYAKAALAFEVKRDGFDLERALKQSADYVGGRALKWGKRIAACFLYPAHEHQHRNYEDRYHDGMFQLIAQWRVGRAYARGDDLWLAIGQETIWDSRGGWHATRAEQMLLGKRAVGGSRREFNRDKRIDLKMLGLVNGERLRRRKL
jgi:hypothetical protein